MLGRGSCVNVANLNSDGGKSAGMGVEDTQIPAVVSTPGSQFVTGQLFQSCGTPTTCGNLQLAPQF